MSSRRVTKARSSRTICHLLFVLDFFTPSVKKNGNTSRLERLHNVDWSPYSPSLTAHQLSSIKPSNRFNRNAIANLHVPYHRSSLPLNPSTFNNKPFHVSLSTTVFQSLLPLLLPPDSLACLFPNMQDSQSAGLLRLANETLVCSPSKQSPQTVCEQFQHSKVYLTGTWQVC